MTDIERQISAFLHEEADRAALPEGMHQRVVRRAKFRRLVMATAAGVAALATVMAGAVMAGAFRSPSSFDPLVPGESPRPTATPRDTSASNCDVEPRELPSGASPGPSRSEEGSYGELRVWGKGTDRVSLLTEVPPELELLGPSELPADHPQRVAIRGNDGVVIPVGEPPASQIFLAWEAGPCGYVVWLGPGLELEFATDYASRF